MGAGNMALFTHNVVQLSGEPENGGETALSRFCIESAVCAALREMPEKSEEELQWLWCK
jgi:hypothetical protein